VDPFDHALGQFAADSRRTHGGAADKRSAFSFFFWVFW
jgi:hypothetical protein